jgi:hypothetical protein
MIVWVDPSVLPSARRPRHFRLCGAGEELDPVLVVAVERTGMLAAGLLEKEGAQLRSSDSA